MATTITYSAKERKELQTIEWAGSGDRGGALRAVKMVRPICDICQALGLDTPLFWFRTCEHGPEQKKSPYWTMKPHTRKVPTYTPVLDAEGKETGEFIKGEVVARVTFTLEPNITEVIKSVRFGGGMLPEQMAGNKGFKYFHELGLAPMCEFKGCGKAWPTVRTNEDGDYCSLIHAKLVYAEQN